MRFVLNSTTNAFVLAEYVIIVSFSLCTELETYSRVISTFRAQGGLSDAKVRILRDLREVFHISQERHKAEARRVANDERLCTVAEL